MTREEFINKIAPLIVKYAKKYNILCPSCVIAQAVLESDGGMSELAINAHNYFGLKYRAGRCPTATGIYYKIGSEQSTSGAYQSSMMQWCKFPSMEAGVQGYFDFINITNYSNLKGVSDQKTYLENIKKDGYATSLKYVENLLSVISKYNLRSYDNNQSSFSIDGKYYRVQCGSFTSKTNADALVAKLKASGFTAITKQYGNQYKAQIGAYTQKSNADDVLKKVKAKGFDAFITYC